MSTSCSLKNPSSQTSLHIEIPKSSSLLRGLLHARVASTVGNYQTTPASLADFDCFAVNVTAPEIPPSNPGQCSNPADIIGARGGWVSAGSPTVAIDLDVPSGPQRLIQIYGVRTPDACPMLGDFASARMGDVYLLGSFTQDIFDDTTVSIQAALDTSKKALGSCHSATAAVPNVTYYVSGPVATPVTLPIPNNSSLTLTSVSATSRGIPTAVDDGTHKNFYYNPHNISGIDSFTYIATDSSGNSGTGTITIKNVWPYTWTGQGADANWSTTGNWCGSVNATYTACTGAGPLPATSDTVIFDGTCTSGNCSATNDLASITIDSLVLDQDYAGTVTQAAASTTFQITNQATLKNGTLALNNVNNSFYIPGALTLSGGNLVSGSGAMSLGLSTGVTITAGLLDLSLSTSVSMGAVTVNGGTLHAPETGVVTYNGNLTYTAGTINSGAAVTAQAYFQSQSTTLNLTASTPITFQNLGIYAATTTGSYIISGTLIVLQNLAINGTSNGTIPSMNGGTITVGGNLQIAAGYSGFTGTTNLLLNGTGTQNITDSGAASYPTLGSNSTGTVIVNSTNAITLQSLTATDIQHVGSGSLTLPSGDSYASITENGSGATVFSGGTLHGNLHIQSGSCSMNGNLSITGSVTLDIGTTLITNSYTFIHGLLTNNGTIL